jgi:DNA-binding transcriptional LysR family regulator
MEKKMELLQLRYFCDAAQTQNFSKTAKKYLVPTSNISQSIKRLEKELGCELFEHRTNRVILNDDGKKFFSSVAQALNILDGAKDDIVGNTDDIRGEIKLICGCNRKNVTEAIEIFKHQYPQVNLTIYHNIDADKNFDILISDICPYEYGNRTLIIDEEICIAMHKSNPLADKAISSVNQLEQERFITMSGDSSIHRILIKSCADAGFTPNIAIQTDDPFYLRKYIELGLGIAFVPALSWQGLFSNKIVLKSVKNIRRKTFAYVPKTKSTKRSVEAFLNILIDVTKNMR